MEEIMREHQVSDPVMNAQLKIIGEAEIANQQLLQSIAHDVHSLKGWVTFFGVVYIIMVVLSILAVCGTLLTGSRLY